MTEILDSFAPRPSIRVVPVQPHCFAFGGFELQMIAAMETARAAGADVKPLDFWRREADFDILHLWGLELQHANTVRWAHAGRKKIVLSALFNYPSWRSTLRHLASSFIGPARSKNGMLRAIDCVTVVNEMQAVYLNRTLRYPTFRTVVIPNAVDDIFFMSADGRDYKQVCDLSDYVLCVGNVCRRKNQLALANVCHRSDIPLLLVGNVLTGEEDYGRALSNVVATSKLCRWIQGLYPGSSALADAYRGAALFALPSHGEQQPIAALEAAAMGKPLLLADLQYAQQEFYKGAALVNPRSEEDIANAVRRVLRDPEPYRVPPAIIELCRRRIIGAAYRDIYKHLAA